MSGKVRCESRAQIYIQLNVFLLQTLAQVKVLTDSCDTASIARDNPDEICHRTLDPTEVTHLLRFVIH